MLRAFAGWFVALFALWVVLANQTVAPELVAGAGAAAFAAGLAVWARQSRPVLPHTPPRLLLELLRALARVPGDLVLLARALAAGLLGRPPTGEIVAVEVDTGSDPDAAGRRVIAIAAHSLAPNTVAIGVDERRGRLVLHRLVERR